MSEGGRFVEDEVEKESGDAEEESSEDVGKPVDEDSGGGLVGDDDDEDEEDETEPVKPEKLQQSRPTKEVVGSGMALTARQRAMQTSKDADRESAPSLIEYPEGLTNPLSRSTSQILLYHIATIFVFINVCGEDLFRFCRVQSCHKIKS